MSPAPSGFTLELYQDTVSDAVNEPVRLLLADAEQLLLPPLSELSEFEQQCVRSLLADEQPDTALCCEHRIESLPGISLRLFALVSGLQRSENESFVPHLHRVLGRVGQCIRHVWSLSSELDEMTDELTDRYEELHLLYQIDRHDNVVDDVGGTALRPLLEDAASHLRVPALVVFAPDDGLEMLVRPGVDESSVDESMVGKIFADELGTAQARVLESLGAKLRMLTRASGAALVLNRMDDPRRDEELKGIDARIMAVPLTVGASNNGVVAVLRDRSSPEFRSHDRKLITVLADQLMSMFRSFRDDLTGLLNRRGFERRLTSFVESDDRPGGLLLYLNLHNFRVLNETCGRVVGDELLRQTAEFLVAETRNHDVVARVGGDEFAILISHCDPATANTVGINFLARLRQREFVWAGRTHEFSASVGVAPIDVHSDDAAQLILVAELACEHAIASGANSVHVYNKDDESVFEQRDRVQWVPKIEDALRTDRFELHAQVIVPIKNDSGMLHHHEILLRLRDERGALIAPNDFIPAAERFQLMPDIDRWVVRHALSTLASMRWIRATSQVVWSINLSGQSLSDERFHTFLVDELEKHNFPYENLCFEVTETAAVANHRAATSLMSSLQARGVSFALDDFGTGLSSFAYLKNLPVTMLKIDGNFVKELVSDPFSRATVDAVNRVGKAMGLCTVAEYVENDEILEVLGGLDVDYAQGFGLGRPVALGTTLAALNQDLVPPESPRSAQVVDFFRKESTGD